ncbi:PHP domain-containing protein [Spirochaeta lutea]|nr:PHP domain-containing protein [Spirochaeta lutea]
MMIDLHSHTTASDGSLSPGELVSLAKELGITHLAVTDHDTVAGLPEAMREAERLGITLIPGIEIEIAYAKGAFHLLGLGIYDYHHTMELLIDQAQAERTRRNLRIVKRMNAAGIPGDYGSIQAQTQGTVIGRPHFAQYLVQKGWAKTVQDAFDRFLGQGKPLFEPRQGIDLAAGIQAIHMAGGKAIIAHPLSLHLNWSPLKRSLQEWKELGLDGIEAYHSRMSSRDSGKVLRIARELGLLVSGGSDFHTPDDPLRRLGFTSLENKRVPPELAAPFMVPML